MNGVGHTKHLLPVREGGVQRVKKAAIVKMQVLAIGVDLQMKS